MSGNGQRVLRVCDRWPNKRGQTGIEGLVVILIIVILAVSALPTIKPAVVKAQYATNVLPIVFVLKSKFELYFNEKGRLPGLGLDAGGTARNTSQLADEVSKIQTFSERKVAAFAADFGGVIAQTNGNHAFREVAFSVNDTISKYSRPNHFQYRADICESNRFLYATGAFGDGDGLPVGTGYAVLEAQKGKRSVLAVWERYEAMAKSPKQAVLVNAAEARKYFGCESAKQARKMNLCWLGDANALLSDDAAVLDRAVADLREAGWKVDEAGGIRWYEVPGAFWWTLHVFFLYALLVGSLMMAILSGGGRRSRWTCGGFLALIACVFVWTLPVSPLAPLGVFLVGGIAIAFIWWGGLLVIRKIQTLTRHFRNRENS